MELAHPDDSGHGAGGGGAANLGVGPYMLVDFVEDLPLETPEKTEVGITCVEARGMLRSLGYIRIYWALILILYRGEPLCWNHRS